MSAWSGRVLAVAIADWECWRTARVIQSSCSWEFVVFRTWVVARHFGHLQLNFYLGKRGRSYLRQACGSLSTTVLAELVCHDLGSLDNIYVLHGSLLSRKLAVRTESFVVLKRGWGCIALIVLWSTLLTGGWGWDSDLLLGQDSHFEILRHTGLVPPVIGWGDTNVVTADFLLFRAMSGGSFHLALSPHVVICLITSLVDTVSEAVMVGT